MILLSCASLAFPIRGCTVDATAIRSLVGYATNLVRFGVAFYIQTEDSGPRYAHIDTLLFSQSGQVIHTLRIDYSQYLDVQNLTEKVVKAMRLQHRHMCSLFESGKLDDRIRGVLGLPDGVPPGPGLVACPDPAGGCGSPALPCVGQTVAARVHGSGPGIHAPSAQTPQVPKAPRVPDFGLAEQPASEHPTTQDPPVTDHPGSPRRYDHAWDAVVEPAEQRTLSDWLGRQDEESPATPDAPSSSPPSSHDWDAAVDAARRRKRRSER